MIKFIGALMAMIVVGGCAFFPKVKEYTFEEIRKDISHSSVSIYLQPKTLNEQTRVAIYGNAVGGKYGLAIDIAPPLSYFAKIHQVVLKTNDDQIIYASSEPKLRKSATHENLYEFYALINYLKFENHKLFIVVDICQEHSESCHQEEMNFVMKTQVREYRTLPL